MFRKLAIRLQCGIRWLLMRLFSLCPMRDAAIFTSFSGKSYSDSPKAISKQLHALAPDVSIIWLFSDPNQKKMLLPECAKAIKIHSIAALHAMATAKIWVDNMPQQDYVYKRNSTRYVQTWHGDRGFKRMLHDAPDHPQNRILKEKTICDAMVSGSTFCEGTYRTGFLYDGEILRYGSPRNDVLMHADPDVVIEIRRKTGVKEDQKVLLYAPTMRNASRRAGIKQPIQPIDIPEALDTLGSDWLCLVRAHSTQLGLGNLPDDPRVIDVSDYEDMADILQITDLLITDYSSSAGDFALTGRPIILFQEDREGFAQSERTFYFDIGASPYVVVNDQQSLIAHLQTLTPEAAKTNDDEILAFYGAYETGHAARAVAEWLIKA